MTACASTKGIVLPGDNLLQDCPETIVPLRVNSDLANKAIVLKQDLARCNADKAALRKWKAELK